MLQHKHLCVHQTATSIVNFLDNFYIHTPFFES
uniref:Uncharacterized protein n=1 Tax=Arundo donax TaxID=35708 RepID=A0A0A9CBQ7_ARUDO